MNNWIDNVVRHLCELPDRNSPDDNPNMMLVTPDELRIVLMKECTSLDGSVTVEDAICEVLDLFPSADVSALEALALVMCKPLEVTLIQRHVITSLIDVARNSFHALDDSCDNAAVTTEGLILPHDSAQKLSDSLDVLDALPDDKPNYVLGPAAKAKWALRSLIGTDI